MKNIYLLFAAFLLLNSGYAQIQIIPDISESQISEWLGGDNVQLSNLIIDCNPSQYAKFNNLSLDNGLEVTQGILMATGGVLGVVGPNDSPSSTMEFPDEGVCCDVDLESIVTGFTVNDVCRLEFDIVPNYGSLLFNFVFGSEEYLEYVNSSFNDAFGFFVSGPGIDGPYSNGAKNFSLVPGTDMAITVDNINDQVNSEYYVNNGDGTTAPFAESNDYIQYDGFTTNILGQVDVIPGETYHLKIVIADTGDTALDSGVFLEKESFRSGSGISGINKLDKLDLEMFPNPTSDWLNIQGDDLKDMLSYEIVSIDGKIVLSASITAKESLKISVMDLEAGVYTINLISAEGSNGGFTWVKK